MSTGGRLGGNKLIHIFDTMTCKLIFLTICINRNVHYHKSSFLHIFFHKNGWGNTFPHRTFPQRKVEDGGGVVALRLLQWKV